MLNGRVGCLYGFFLSVRKCNKQESENCPGYGSCPIAGNSGQSREFLYFIRAGFQTRLCGLPVIFFEIVHGPAPVICAFGSPVVHRPWEQGNTRFSPIGPTVHFTLLEELV